MFRGWFSSGGLESSPEMAKPSGFLAPQELGQSEQGVKEVDKTFFIHGKVLITSEAKTLEDKDFFQILHDWGSTYRGPFLLEGMVKCIVLTSIPNLHFSKWMDGGKYGTVVGLEAKFSFKKPESIPQKYLTYNHSARKRLGGDSYQIVIDLEFSPMTTTAQSIDLAFKNSKGPKFYGKSLRKVLPDIFTRAGTNSEDEVMLC
nr:MAG: matrix protein [Bat tupavirus CX1]